MTTNEAAKIIWDYMLMHHELKKADLLFVLGHRDTRTAEFAAELFKQGWAPLIAFSGSGSVHNDKPGREKFIGSTEAEVFAGIAIQNGVPADKIIIENRSQNTGDNFKFTIEELNKRNIFPKRVIAVQKPYTERRTYATGKIYWPDVDIILVSQPLNLESYLGGPMTHDYILNSMVGDLQRIIEYPKQGLQIEQDVPKDVMEAFNYLVGCGYTKRLVKT